MLVKIGHVDCYCSAFLCVDVDIGYVFSSSSKILFCFSAGGVSYFFLLSSVNCMQLKLSGDVKGLDLMKRREILSTIL